MASKARLTQFRTLWGRRLAKFKKEHPRLYKKVRFRWIDVGIDDTPKIDSTGIRIAYFPKDWYEKYFSHVKAQRMPVVVTYAFEKDEFTISQMKKHLKDYGVTRVKRIDTNAYDAF